jgi:hypothetical protein
MEVSKAVRNEELIVIMHIWRGSINVVKSKILQRFEQLTGMAETEK